MEQVAVFKSNRIKPLEFASMIDEVANLYKSKTNVYPLVAVERNNHGHAVLLQLGEHLKYPAMYRHPDDKLGWLTNNVTRPIMINAFIEGVESNLVKFNDKITLGECMTLINNNGKIEAVEGKHDDCVVSSAIGIQLLAQFKKLDIYNDIGKKIYL
jgi:hypothetical protein